MAADVKVATPRCALDANGCVSLQDILVSFNASINEQHAWALCYQCAKCFRGCLQAARQGQRPFCVSELEHVLLHRDGHVHPDSVLGSTGVLASRLPANSEAKLVSELGVVLFRALDFGLGEEEERHLSPDLERLIDLMTSADEAPERNTETDDEGIERDSGDGDEEACGPPGPGHAHSLSLTNVIEHCVQHLGPPSAAQADAHYRAVCRALVSEALELATFLERVSEGTGDLQARAEATADLAQLQFTDWARLWVQVIHELRHGVKLKKVASTCYSRAPIEFEMTPYEILMDDIRSRRYKLNKVMVDGELPPRVKKDAHAVILEFIRSRPPLRKASERKLNPPRSRPSTARELLLESIKRGPRLRPLLAARRRSSSSLLMPTQEAGGGGGGGGRDEAGPSSGGAAGNASAPKTTRRLIKVDFSVLEMDDDDEDEDEGQQLSAKGSAEGAEPRLRAPWQRTGTTAHQEYLRYLDSALESYDLATQCPARRPLSRRHTVLASTAAAAAAAAGAGGASASTSGAALGAGVGVGASEGAYSLPSSLPPSRPPSRGAVTPSSASSEAGSRSGSHSGLGSALPELSWSRSSLQDDLLHSKNWQAAMECLSLTLEEIVHIRSVLTKAELESLPVEGRVKEDVEKKKVCFLCLKTRFSIFGPWGQLCKLCKRTVCTKCCSKMRIPTEHFSRVPVFALSPGLSSSPEEEEEEAGAATSFPRLLVSRLLVPESSSRNSVGSAPASPSMGTGAAAGCGGGGGAGAARGHSASEPPSGAASSLADSFGDGPQSLPALSPDATASTASTAASERRSHMLRSKTLGRPETKKEKLKGLQMTVCSDCKTMVLQIIKSSRTSRSNAIRNLTLNLSPVY